MEVGGCKPAERLDAVMAAELDGNGRFAAAMKIEA